MEISRWDRFMYFMSRWYGIPATALLFSLNIAAVLFFFWLLGPDSKAAFWLAVTFFIATLIFSYVAFYYHGKKRYGAGMWGEPGYESQETYATTKETKRRLASFQPDSASDARIKKIGKKYNKLPPPEES